MIIRHKVFYMVFFISSAVFSTNIYSQEITEAQLEYWGNVIEEIDKSEANVVKITNPMQVWPAVYSVNYSASLTEQQQKHQASFRQMSFDLIHFVEDFCKHLPDSDMDVFLKKANSLLNIRNAITHNSSYVNWVIADTIHRELYVNLISRYLLESAKADADLSNIVSSLSSQKLNISLFLKIARHELGMPILSRSETIGTGVEVYRRLWKKLEPNSIVIMPERMDMASSYDMLRGQYISLLLWRLMVSDAYINTYLPLVEEYTAKVESHSIDDEYSKIKKVIGRSLHGKESLGSRVMGMRAAAVIFSDLMKSVKATSLKQELLY